MDKIDELIKKTGAGTLALSERALKNLGRIWLIVLIYLLLSSIMIGILNFHTENRELADSLSGFILILMIFSAVAGLFSSLIVLLEVWALNKLAKYKNDKTA